jgi:autoinducer 2 (AI-2) kinase
MAAEYVVGLDIGGGGGRCLLLNVSAGTTTIASRKWQAHLAPDTSGLGFSLDVDEIFSQLADATQETIARAGIEPRQVRAVAATAMREGMVVLATDGSVLLACPNRDARAALEAIELASERGGEIYRRTGRWPYPIFPAPRLMWLSRSKPDDFARTRAMLSLSEWLTWRLCGETVAEPTQAGESLVFDLESRAWADDLIDALGLPRELFPPIRQAGSTVGTLTKAAAIAFGLSPDTRVVLGGADSQCALLGMGVVDPDQWGINAGTTAPVQLVTASPVLDPEERLWTGHHLMSGRWLLESNAGPLGESLEWTARILYPTSPRPIARMFAEAALSPPGAAGFLSTVGAEVWHARNLGLTVGSLTLSHMLSPDHEDARRHVARSFLEGVAFGLRANVEQIVSVTKSPPTTLRIAGGVARNPGWPALLADVLEIPVECAATTDATALGAALCAATGSGFYGSLTEAAQQVPTHITYEPAESRARDMREIYKNWSALRHERKPADRVAQDLAVPWILRENSKHAASRARALRPRIFVTADMDEQSLGLLRTIGDVTYSSFRDSLQLLTGPSLVSALADVQVFITEVDLVDALALDGAPNLRVVASCRNDTVNVDVAACTAFGIPVLHAPGRNAVAVAELTLALILTHARKLRAASTFLYEPNAVAGDIARMGQAFSALRGAELWSLVVGLIGFGAVGRQVAGRLRACGARVLVSDPAVDADMAARHDVELVSLDGLLSLADIVSLHAAVTPHTRGLLNASTIARMKRGAYLVNTARAALIDEDALAESLRNGHLSGAALDVFSTEPPGPDHPLLRLENVIATPHVGGNTRQVAFHQGATIAHDLDRLLRSERPRHVLNPNVLDTFDWHRPHARPSRDELTNLMSHRRVSVSDLQRDKDKGQQTRAARSQIPQEASISHGNAREHLRRLLDEFAKRIAIDASMRQRSKATQVTLYFHLNDFALDLTISLDNGTVSAHGDAPKGDPEVELRMPASVFDGIFAGRLSAMQEAMAGRMSFTGDAGKAMALQELQSDLVRLYREARDSVGAPEHLEPDSKSDIAVTATVGRGERASEIIRIVDELYASHLITATGGNVSARIAPGHSELWITPSRMFKGELSEDALVRIDLEGRPLDPGARSPSSERLMHTAVYRARPEAEAVIHCHAPHATILANADLPFLPISTEAAFFADLPRVPFIMPGTAELAAAIEECAQRSWATLMKNHGLLVAGRSLRSAADMAEVIERSAEIILGCYAVGKTPPTLPDDVVAKLRRMGDMVA